GRLATRGHAAGGGRGSRDPDRHRGRRHGPRRGGRGCRVIVGEIQPGREGEAPTFKIIRHEWEPLATDPNVRPCEHGQFVLDPKWATVTCGKCQGRVDPFAALLLFAEWYDTLKRRWERAEEAERRLHREHLRDLRR